MDPQAHGQLHPCSCPRRVWSGGCGRWRYRLGPRSLLESRLGCRRRGGGRSCWQRLSPTRPDEDASRFIEGQALALDELVLQGFEMRLIQLELELEGPIRQAATLAQEGDGLI